MTAYELADEVTGINDAIESEYNRFIKLDDASNMLRQQADRIAELEKGLEGTIGYHCWQAGLQEGLSRQTKPLSDEEILDLFDEYGKADLIGFARAIEAKVRGEK
jgi:hypothetical protein